jgi:cytochrome bd-type quinol oxidase subunit 2
MSFLYNVLVVLHFIGLASLIGGFLVQIKTTPRVVNNAMLHGALTQLVTGVLLVGLRYPLNASDPVEWSKPDNAKIGVKLVVLLVILALILANRKKDQITNAVWGLIGGLAILNVIIAVFWH